MQGWYWQSIAGLLKIENFSLKVIWLIFTRNNLLFDVNAIKQCKNTLTELHPWHWVRFVFLLLSLFKQLQMIDSQMMNMQMIVMSQLRCYYFTTEKPTKGSSHSQMSYRFTLRRGKTLTQRHDNLDRSCIIQAFRICYH